MRIPRASSIFGNEIHKAQYYTGHVFDMGKVAPHFTMVKKPDWGAFNDRFGKQENRHIGPSPWAINCEEPESRDGKTVKVAVRISHQLVGLFGRGVETDRPIGFVVDGKRQFCIGAVNR